MKMRKNAGRGLALVTELVHEIAMKRQPNAVGAIGPYRRLSEFSKYHFRARWFSPLIFAAMNSIRLRRCSPSLNPEAPKLCESIGVKFEAEIIGQFGPAGI